MSTQSTALPGTVFGRLIIREVFIRAGHTCCLTLCECSKEKVIRLADLKSGATKSCGCLQKEAARRLLTTHGSSSTPAHSVWRYMLQRTTSPSDVSWEFYGGRGITVCPEWQEFEKFLADMGQPPKGRQLDRIDNNLGYSKENCRWATPKENSRNKRNNVLVECGGRVVCLTEAAEMSGVAFTTLQSRVKKGLTGAALFRPSKPHLKSRNLHERPYNPASRE